MDFYECGEAVLSDPTSVVGKIVSEICMGDNTTGALGLGLGSDDSLVPFIARNHGLQRVLIEPLFV